MQQSFYEYALTTITNRALPDVRDGLKPVHRRILYSMNQLNLVHQKPHKKSARIVGDILGKYHPHGDSSVYEAMVRLAQDFSLMVPLVDGHGNFGSIDGDGAAAMRYTEARLSFAGEKMSADLEKDVVSFQPNYDDSEVEPTVLPSRFPNLLINGSEGIATGMATNIPTHNPIEVANALKYMIQNGYKAKEKTLLTKLSAPDYPMGGIIVNEEEVNGFYTKGYGKVTMRGKYFIEETKKKSKRIVFTELPRKAIGTKYALVQQIVDLVNDKVLSEVLNVEDESSREGIQLVIEVKKTTDIERFMTKLWLKTNLQSSERMQFLVLIDGKPKTITLMQYFKEYIKFQEELHIKRNTHLLSQVNDRLEVVDGLLQAHSVMDALIDAIRSAPTQAEVFDCLTKGKTNSIEWKLKKHKKIAKGFRFTKRQAEAILNRRLRTLTGLDVLELSKEQKELVKKKSKHESIIKEPEALKNELLKDVDLFRSEYNIERRSEVTTQTTDLAVLEEKSADKVGIIVDANGFAQTKPNVSGTSLDVLLREDTDTSDTIAILTSLGNLYNVKIEEVPKDKKLPLQVLAGMEFGESILHVTLGSKISSKVFFVLTKYGKGKELNGEELGTKGFRSKSFYTKLDTKKNDEVLIVTDKIPNKWLVVETNLNRGGRVNLKDSGVPFKPYGKVAKGSTLVKLKKDEIITSAYLPESLEDEIKNKSVAEWTDVSGLTVKPL